MGDCVRIQTGKLDANASSPDGQYPFFTCSQEPLRIASFSYDCECVLVAGNGDLNVKYHNGKFDAYQRTYIIESLDNQALDVRYLYRFMSVYVDQLRAMRVGGVVKYIKLGYLTETRIPLPALAEQRRIAEVLDCAEAIRTKRRSALAQLDILAQSVFFDMFGDPATNPKGWSRQTLGDITQKITDGEHLNPPFSQTGMPIVMAGDVLEDQIDFGASKMVEIDLGNRFRRKCDPERNDILIVSRGATIGRLCVVGEAPEFCLMGSVILLKPFKDKIDSRFLSVFLKHPVSRHALYKTSGSSAQQAIYLKDVKKMVCIVPPISLQNEFARRVAAIEKLKAIHRVSLTKLDALFATLQHRAFRGEL